MNIGERYFNTKGLEFVIIDNCTNPNKKKIKFINSGYECEAWCSRIKTGNIRDRLSPSVYGVGIMDVINGNNHILYSRWAEMLNRCYNVNSSDYETYGAKGIYVCQEWHKLSNYIKDIEKKENYDKLCEDSYNWCVDKDYMSKESKYYSNETTVIISRANNVLEQVGRYNLRKRVLQFTKQGELIREYESLQQAHEVTKVNKGNIGSCCRGEKKSAGGYFWKYKKEN